MMIDKLKGIEPLENISKSQKARKPEQVKQSDSISISPESQRLSEAYLAKKVAMDAPDIREDKVLEMTKKLEDPNYVQNAIRKLADQFIDNGLQF
ncbi:MAG: flagellar biosynthesis protein FlgM [Treponema sp.]|nr:MAG: flagellar biosynthesis protein FlgM [Treponema sp.]